MLICLLAILLILLPNLILDLFMQFLDFLSPFFSITTKILSDKKWCQFKGSSRIKTINNFKRAMTYSLASGSNISKLSWGQKKISLPNVLPHKAFSKDFLNFNSKLQFGRPFMDDKKSPSFLQRVRQNDLQTSNHDLK